MALSSVRYVMVSPFPASVSYSAVQTLPDGVIPEEEQLTVYLNGTALTYATDYTLNPATNLISLIGDAFTNLDDQDVVIIQRETNDVTRLVVFEDNAGMTAEDLNLAFDQVFFLVQEALDGARTAMQKDPTQTYWDAKGLPVENARPATTGNGLVTKNQVFDILGGAETATVDAVEEWCFTGDGILDTFPLPGLAIPSSSCEYLVTIDGNIIHCTCGSEDDWLTSTSSGGSGIFSMEQQGVINDTFPSGACITAGPVTAATIVAALEALQATGG
jgi:hypothetical protein